MSNQTATYGEISIETPENIAFRYEIAGPGSRMMAHLIDFMLMVLVMGTIDFVLANMAASYRGPGDPTGLIVFAAVVNLLLIGFGGFYLFFEYFMNGQSPGKSAMGIRVIQENGAAAGFQALVARNLFRLIDCSLPFQYIVGVLTMTFAPNAQRMGDMVAGTIVIKERSNTAATRYRWKMGKSRSVFRKEVNLTREEFDFLITYVEHFREFDLAQRNRLSNKLARLIVYNHKLDKHPDYAELVQVLLSKENLQAVPQHKRAEDIFKKLLEHYGTQQSTLTSAAAK